MGAGSYSTSDWAAYSTSRNYANQRPEDVINTSTIDADFLPKNFKNGRRESRDSAEHPRSTPIIVAGDTTGSMGKYAGMLIKEGMARFALALLDRNAVSDPQIMGAVFDDVKAWRGNGVIQATQFESDIRINQQFEKLKVTGQGGGNHGESYDLPWMLARTCVVSDAWEKRGERGVLFTYGDEPAPHGLTASDVALAFGQQVRLPASLTPRQILDAARERWDVFHFVIEQGDYCSDARGKARVYDSWRVLLGERVIPCPDASLLAELMVSTIEITRQGREPEDVAATWGGDATRRLVEQSVRGLLPAGA
jgi:hypothetical protein